MRDATGGVRGRVPQPRMLVVAGAKGGVGTTTIAVNVAAAFARIGTRTVLVDGDLGKCDVAALCGTREGYTIGDVLAGRRRVGDALHAGPGAMRVLPGAWATGHLTDCDPDSQQRLLSELIALGDADQIVIDAGCGANRVVERFWRSADCVLLVSTAEDASVMDAYALLKSVAAGHPNLAVHTVINRVASERQASETHRRLETAARRFLTLDIKHGATIVESREITTAAAQHYPAVLLAPASPAGRATIQLAANLCRLIPPGENNELQQTIQAARA